MARTSVLFSVSLYPNKTSFNFNNLSNLKYACSSFFFFSKLNSFYHKTKTMFNVINFICAELRKKRKKEREIKKGVGGGEKREIKKGVVG